MGETPDEIREDIERTRERMSEHADALAYKADVPARTMDRVDDVKESVVSKLTQAKDAVVSTVTGAKDTVESKASDAKSTVMSQASHAKDSVGSGTPSTQDVKDQAQRAKGLAEDNPLGLAIGAVALGFVAGLLIPATRFENEKVGGLADDVKDRAKSIGQDAAERVKDVASTTATAAKDAATDAGSRHAEELKETASATSPMS